ncbi:MAG TPA: hypothetical protein DD381_11365 [Lentisphaeria bacterium]|nr:MAG: hypothetical protein A2X47_12750 [Lentisphaerae bacterium GWF2_38_69]HBM16928.1 hypothetical protein [Lentisphaeria bacterium]
MAKIKVAINKNSKKGKPMKKLTALLSLSAIIALGSGCSYFSCEKASKETAAPKVSDSATKIPAPAQNPTDQGQDVIEVQELELDAVEVPASMTTDNDTQVVVEGVEVDAVGVVPSEDDSAQPADQSQTSK